MLGREIFIACALCLASPTRSSILGRVFPNDVKWVPPIQNSRYENSEVVTNDAKDFKVCDTNECKRVADEFLSGMNKSVDPCENFYEYTCGGWEASKPIPPSSPVWSRFMLFQNTVHHRIKDILETDPEPSDILPVRQAKQWYRSCMDTDTLQKRGMKSIETILIHTGGWPMVMDEEEWDEDLNNWQDVESNYARLTGSYTFYDLGVGEIEELSDKFSPLILQPQKLPLANEMPLKYRDYSENDYEAYVHFIYEVASLFIELGKADVSHDRLMKEAKDVVEFEKKLFEIQDTDNLDVMPISMFYDIYQHQVSDPSQRINFKGIIDSLLNMVNTEADPLTPLYAKTLKWTVQIGQLLAETPTKTIVNYIHWNFVANMLPYTTENARDIFYELLMEEYGIEKRPPRWSECVEAMKMTHAAAYVFVQKYVTKEREEAVTKMAENIRRGLEDQMKTANWVDEDSRKIILDKLMHMKVFVGFPEWYRKKEAVLKSYKGLIIGNDYFDNVLSYIKYSQKQKYKEYRKPAIDVWLMDPITINAGYTPLFNSLIVPAADFQAPLLTPHLPNAVNYGILGLLLGHEIGHGFDDTGITFGKDGNRSELPEMVLKNYFQRAECFTHQFDKYYGETEPPADATPIPGSKRSSQRTGGENIADTTGIQSVYRAYKKEKEPEGEMRLPGLEEYTDDQLFYISFGAMWCEIGTPEYEQKRDDSDDEHSPSRIRVIGAVSNAAGFAEAFNCPAGSPMNPINKCSIWETTNSDEHKKKKRIKNSKRSKWQWNI